MFLNEGPCEKGDAMLSIRPESDEMALGVNGLLNLCYIRKFFITFFFCKQISRTLLAYMVWQNPTQPFLQKNLHILL